MRRTKVRSARRYFDEEAHDVRIELDESLQPLPEPAPLPEEDEDEEFLLEPEDPLPYDDPEFELTLDVPAPLAAAALRLTNEIPTSPCSTVEPGMRSGEHAATQAPQRTIAVTATRLARTFGKINTGLAVRSNSRVT
ncbi:MAG: hypothetical protein AABZ29_07225 [Gemmatimonadota bacterium]